MANLITLTAPQYAVIPTYKGQTIYLKDGTGTSKIEVVTGNDAGTTTVAAHTGTATYGPFLTGSIKVTAITGTVKYEMSGDTTSPFLDDPVLTAAQVTSLTASIPTDGSVFAVSEVTPYVTRTSTGTPVTGACELAGYDCTAVSGTQTITIYDGTSTSGTVIVPATTLTVGRVEFTWKRALSTGCHVVFTGAGSQTVNVLVG